MKEEIFRLAEGGDESFAGWLDANVAYEVKSSSDPFQQFKLSHDPAMLI